jgi:hypothetical protein
MKVIQLQIAPIDDVCNAYEVVYLLAGPSNRGVPMTLAHFSVYVQDDMSLKFSESYSNTLYYANGLYSEINQITSFSNGYPYASSCSRGFAISEPTSFGRYLFVHFAGSFYTYKMNYNLSNQYQTSVTLLRTNLIEYHGYTTEGHPIVAEVELRKVGNSWYYAYSDIGYGTTALTVLVFEEYHFSHSSYEIPAKSVSVGGSTANDEYVKGIEFTENMQYIYFTRKGGINLKYISMADMMTENANGIQMVSIPQSISDYDYSYIERGRDNDMYLIRSFNGTLSRITNANTPTSCSVNSNVGGITGLSAQNNGNVNNNYGNDVYKCYYLPKQLDDMDYANQFEMNEDANFNYDVYCNNHKVYIDLDHVMNIPAGIGHHWYVSKLNTSTNTYESVCTGWGVKNQTLTLGPDVNNPNICNITFTLGATYKITFGLWGDCVPWTSHTEYITIPNNLENLDASFTGTINGTSITCQSSTLNIAGSAWYLYNSNSSAQVIGSQIGSTQWGASATFSGLSTGFYLVRHGVWSGCSGWKEKRNLYYIYGVSKSRSVLVKEQTVDEEGNILSEIDHGMIVNVFPNPTKDYINIEGLASGVSYEIYSAQGSLVRTDVYNEENIDVQDLPKGFYMVKANGQTAKFVKE